jgi:DNA-binding NtrC family response regulator
VSDARHVLVVDDGANVRKVLGALLEQAGHATTRAASAEEALDVVRAQDPDVVLTDLRMSGMDGLDLLSRLREQFPEIPVVVLTAHGTIDTAVEAMRRGAFDFLTKPFDRDRVLETVAKALGQAQRSRREFQGPLETGAPCGIVGRSAAMDAVRRLVERVAPSPSTVLVTGETGVGKELVARALHEHSLRRGGPFVPVNCGALPDTLVEAELFGVEKGAYTGADRTRPGRFELADGGTLFLDEVGELPPHAQVKLLRVLQDRVVERVGGASGRTVDVRLVAATNRRLEDAVREGRFREDLLFRLRVVEIRVPPLRERLEDVPALVDVFAAKHAARLGRPLPAVSAEAHAALRRHRWPGNVRELENAVERAVLLAESEVIGPSDLGLAADAEGSASRDDATGGIKDAARAAAVETERRLIREALEQTGGNVTHAAERLSLSRRGLQLKMKELGLRS